MLAPEPAPALAPLGTPLTTTHRVISYTYDSLYRLTEADYSTGEYYEYAYDAVGNRLSLTTGGGVVNYAYDAANRLTSVNGVVYTWDNNGNLLSDGLRSYSYRCNCLSSLGLSSGRRASQQAGGNDRTQSFFCEG